MNIQQKFMNPKYIYGYNQYPKNNLYNLSQTELCILYPAGNCLIKWNNQSQQIIQTELLENTCYYYDNQKYLVISGKTNQNPKFLIYENQNGYLNQIKQIYYNEIELDYFQNIKINDQILMAIGVKDIQLDNNLNKELQYYFFILNWQKNQILGISQLKNPVIDIFFNPQNQNFYGTVSQDKIRYFKIIDKQIKNKEIENKQDTISTITCAQVLKDGSVIAGSLVGELFYYDQKGDFKQILKDSPINKDQFVQITCIILNKNYLYLGTNKSIIFQYNYIHDVKLNIKYNQSFKINESMTSIYSILIFQNDMYLGLSNNQLIKKSINEEQNFEYLITQFNHNQIIDLDFSIFKNQIVTISYDGYLIIWDLYSKQILFSIYICQNPISVSFHPSGNFLIIVTMLFVNYYLITNQNIELLKEFKINKCNKVQFSRGGNFFLLQNINSIYQYCSLTFKCLNCFRLNDIQDIYLEQDDQYLFVIQKNNMIQYFKLDSTNQSFEIIQNKYKVKSLFVSYEKNVKFKYDKVLNIVGKGGFIQKVGIQHVYQNDQNINLKINVFQINQIECSDNIDYIYILSQNQLDIQNQNQQIFLVDNKEIILYNYKLDQIVNSIHNQKKITKVLFLPNNEGFLTISNNIMIYYQISTQPSLQDQFLYNEQNIIEMNKKFQKTNQKIMDQQDYIYQNQQKQQNIVQQQQQKIQDNIKEQQNNFSNQIQIVQNQFDEEYKTIKDQIEKQDAEHLQKVEQMNQDFIKKINLKQNQYDQFIEQKFDYEIEVNHSKQNLKFQNYMQQSQQLNISYKNYKNKINQLKEEFQQKKIEIENQYDLVIQEIKDSYEQETNININQIDVNQIEKTKQKEIFREFQQLMEGNYNKSLENLEDIKMMQYNIQQYYKEKDQHNKEIHERIKTLNEKQKRIQILQKKVQELEKFKFVLDYKIKELKRDIKPKEEEIQKMKEHILNMNEEILHFKRTNNNLGLVVQDMNLKHIGMNNDLQQMKEIYNQNLEYFNKLILAFQNCKSENYKELKKNVKQIYQQFLLDQKQKISKNQNTEFDKQRVHLEQSINTLKMKFSRNMDLYKEENERIMKQNVDLIIEINDLTRQLQIVQEKKQISQLNEVKKRQMNDIKLKSKRLKHQIKLQDIEIQNYKEQIN